METNTVVQEKNWKYPIEVDHADIFSEAYQMELRVIIPDHSSISNSNDALKDYCSTYTQTEICKL